VIAQIGLYGHTDIYEKRVYTLPKHLGEKIRGSTSTRSGQADGAHLASRPRTSKCRSRDRTNPSATGIEGRVTALDNLVKIPIEWESMSSRNAKDAVIEAMAVIWVRRS
jgi:hypothetical protein